MCSMESRKEKHLIYDPLAMEATDRLRDSFRSVKRKKLQNTRILAETVLFDRMLGSFLCEHANTVVLNLACGLDTRCYRMEGLYRTWYNLDRPEILAVRKSLFPVRDSVRETASDFHNSLRRNLAEESDHPILVLLKENSLCLSAPEIRSVFHRIDDCFDCAAIFMETMSPFALRCRKELFGKETAAKVLYRANSDPSPAEGIPPFRLVESRSLAEGMCTLSSRYRFFAKLPPVHRLSGQILKYQKEK